jgi:hypothetical protein
VGSEELLDTIGLLDLLDELIAVSLTSLALADR